MMMSNYRVDRSLACDDDVVIVVNCPYCRKQSVFDVDKDVWRKGEIAYKNGSSVKDAWPTLSPSQRELLLTGICDECWNIM